MRPKDERARPSERYRPSNFQNATVPLSLSPWPWLLCRIHYFFMLKWFLKPKMGVNWTPVDISERPSERYRPSNFQNAPVRLSLSPWPWLLWRIHYFFYAKMIFETKNGGQLDPCWHLWNVNRFTPRSLDISEMSRGVQLTPIFHFKYQFYI